MFLDEIAQSIADEIIESARLSGDDPIAWVTGNSYFPALRSFTQAETIWQSGENADGELFNTLTEKIEKILADENVALESPEWDNALYAVDLTRFEYAEDSYGDTLQSEWRMYNSGTSHV